MTMTIPFLSADARSLKQWILAIGVTWIVASPPLMAEVAMLQPAASPADNPLKGLVPYSDYVEEGESHFPHSLEFSYLPLAKLMKGPSRLDWQPLEQWLDQVASRGHQAIFRLWLEYPGQPSGLPDFLRDQGVKVTAWKNPDEKKTCYTPDYEDERLVQALETFIAELGKRYDGDPRMGFITAGLLGSWGEWHTYPREDLFASITTQRRVLDAYEEAFDQTPILLRYPAGKDDPQLAMNTQYSMGYHDDSFAWGTLDRGIQDDWFFMSLLNKAGEAARNKWRTQPIGGEVRPELWGQIFDAKPSHPKAQDVAECVRQTHVTWLMDSGMFKEKAKASRHAGAVAQVQKMGYDFHVTQAELTWASSSLHVRLRVVNQGVAPFYQDWRLELAALSADGSVVQRWPVDWKLTGLLPDDPPRAWEAKIKTSADRIAGLTLALRVIHPLAQGKPLRFANAEQDRHAEGWLSLMPVPGR